MEGLVRGIHARYHAKRLMVTSRYAYVLADCLVETPQLMFLKADTPSNFGGKIDPQNAITIRHHQLYR